MNSEKNQSMKDQQVIELIEKEFREKTCKYIHKRNNKERTPKIETP
jgi:hypothetical protein